MSHPATGVAIKNLFNNLAYLALACFLIPLALLPLRWSQAVGALVGTLFYRLGKKRVHVARCNLRACFPHMPADELENLLHRNMMETGKWFAEFGVAWLWPVSAVNARIRVRNEELLTAAFAEKCGVVLIVPHIGNWEMTNTWVATHYPLSAMYKPLESSWFEKFILWRRSRMGSAMEPATTAGVRKIMKNLKQGEMVGLLPDHLPSAKAGVYAPFFGVPALTGKLTSSLVRASHSAAISLVAVRLPKGQGFEIVVQRAEGIGDPDPGLAAAALNRAIEDCVNLAPEQYQWVYKRFSKPPPGFPNIYAPADAD